MLAQTAEGSFSRAGWSFEIKWDGVRALGFVRRHGATQEIALYSRTLHRLNAQFPDVVASLAALEVDDAAAQDDGSGELDGPKEQTCRSLRG